MRLNRLFFILSAISLFASHSSVVLATEAVAPTSSAGGLAKVVMGLLMVLAVIALVAWAVKHLSLNKLGAYSVAKVVGGVNVGTRERVVVVEIGGKWVVVGVASGVVNALATLDAVPNLTEDSQQALKPLNISAPQAAFANWLKQALDKNSSNTSIDDSGRSS